LIDRHLGKIVTRVGLDYSDIFANQMAVFLHEGDCTVDINEHLRSTLKQVRGLSVCSADTILRGVKELASPSVEHTSPAGVAHEFNINIRLTKLLLKALPKTAQLDQTSAYTVDYDKQVVATEKYDARKTCKKCSGYLSGIASIGKHIIYIEGAHDDFSPSFICFPQFIGSVKYFAIKHQLKVS
jgi:hypothetical protein